MAHVSKHALDSKEFSSVFTWAWQVLLDTFYFCWLWIKKSTLRWKQIWRRPRNKKKTGIKQALYWFATVHYPGTVSNKIASLTRTHQTAPVPEWLRRLIFSALNRRSSHRCGFEPARVTCETCGWTSGFSRGSPVFRMSEIILTGRKHRIPPPSHTHTHTKKLITWSIARNATRLIQYSLKGSHLLISSLYLHYECHMAMAVRCFAVDREEGKTEAEMGRHHQRIDESVDLEILDDSGR